ncbi:ribokinase [Parapedobacter pyrenivorans]|uniref:Ribokinase n=1 Tax=Parapedobacter pyrenivorans TaxID=1305674 RepID=A0A917HXF0_9SPHI|nr:ribokinase [Parapedobacter pyrenivorans]GGG92368.1 ribokinase [Parapedobacter pyrenivorans]
MGNKIIVVGSMNMDMVVKTSHIPQPGETVLGGSFFMNPGGKGANQAVAVARLGGDVAFVGKIGDDIFGKQSSQLFDEEGVDINGILSDHDSPSGIALITVDDNGENSIVVAPGANAHLEPVDVEKVLDKYPDSKILLMQLEIPMRTVEFAARIAREKGMQVILNPAPANELVPSVFHLVDVITPNVNEAEMLSGIRIVDIPSARQAAESIHAQGVNHVIVTLGKQGAALLENGVFHHIPAPSVETVDTTAAGDVFNGALAVAIGEGKGLTDAVSFACRAASIAVTRMGAQSSIPFRNEVLLSNMTP